MASHVFSIPGVTLLCLVEALLVDRALPQGLSWNASFSKTFFVLLGFHYLVLFVYWSYIYNFFICPLRRFPSPRRFLFSVIYGRLSAKVPPGQHFLECSVDTPNDGILLLRGVFSRNRLLITKPNALADLLVNNAYDFKKPRTIRDFLRHVLGNGLIIVEGDVHKFQRKHLLPAFSFRHIKDLYPMMWIKAQTLVHQLFSEIQSHPAVTGDAKQTAMSGTTEINTWAGKVTLDIIGIAGLGREINALKNSDDQIVKDYEELLEPEPEKLFFFFMNAFVSAKLTAMLPWKMNEVFSRVTGSLRSNCRQMVRDKREAMKGGQQNFDILSLLIQSNDFSDDELVDQLLTFLAAGHETTSSAFTWATYLLATHKDVQRHLREEIREALPADPEYSAFDFSGVLERLPLLNGICNETLRLYPTVPITIRVAVRDTTLAGHRIPRGTEIIVCPWAVNRTPELWGRDANDFKPERWIDDGKPNNRGGAESNFSLLTFLHGPRSCIGQNFAKAEMRCLLAAFVTNFEWDLDMPEEKIVPAGVITIKPRNGLKVRLTKIA